MSRSQPYQKAKVQKPVPTGNDYVTTSLESWTRAQRSNYQQLLQDENFKDLDVERIGFNLFDLYNDHYIKRHNLIKIDQIGKPKKDDDFRGTIYDARLGAVSANDVCKNDLCGQLGEYCNRHLGYIKLAVPVINPNFLKQVVGILNMLCPGCEGFKLPLDQIRKTGVLELPPRQRIPILEQLMTKLPNCGSTKTLEEGDIECSQVLAPKYSIPEVDKETSTIRKQERYINDKGKLTISKPKTPVDMDEIIEMIGPDHIPDEVAKEVLGMDVTEGLRPLNTIMNYILVYAPSDRTNNIVNGRIKSDEIGDKYNAIIKANNALLKIMETDNYLEKESFRMGRKELVIKVNNLMSASHSSKASSSSLATTFSGKTGFVRSEFVSTRTNWSARTVITQDPDFAYYQVKVPIEIARKLTWPEVVTPDNRDYLTKLLRDGEISAFVPGSNSKRRHRGILKRVTEANRMLYTPRVGDTVHRWMQNGDWILINRQPSLHGPSIMGHEVIRHPGRSLKIRQCVVGPYNADFDGDEMNGHFVQTVEAMEEVKGVMSIRNNLRSGEDGRLQVVINYTNIQAIADMTADPNSGSTSFKYPDERFIEEIFSRLDRQWNWCVSSTFVERLTSVYPSLRPLSKHIQSINSDISPEEARDEANKLLRNNDLITILTIYAKAKVLTGRMVFSLSLPANLQYYRATGDIDRKEVLIKRGILLKGTLAKAMLGGSYGSIADVIEDYYGGKTYEFFFETSITISDIWIKREGLSISYSDTLPINPESEDFVANHLKQLMIQISQLETQKTGVEQFDEEVEEKITKLLSETKNVSINAAKKEPLSNPFIRSYRSGTKGSIANLSRIKFGGMAYMYAEGRLKPTTPGPKGVKRNNFYQHIKKTEPVDYGIGVNSLAKGMTLPEMLINAKATREGILKGSLKTAEGGAIFRKLRNYLQDLVIHSDLSVRDSKGHIIQSLWDYSGLDPAKATRVPQKNSMGINHKSFGNIGLIADTINVDRGYY